MNDDEYAKQIEALEQEVGELLEENGRLRAPLEAKEAELKRLLELEQEKERLTKENEILRSGQLPGCSWNDFSEPDDEPE